MIQVSCPSRARLALALALGASFAGTSASARPGTPNAESSWSPAPGQMTVKWQNTASEDGIVFDIEGQRDSSVGNWTPPGGVSLRQMVSYTFRNLPAGRHCFRIWSRTGPQGMRSGVPSAFTCAEVAAAGLAAPAGPPQPSSPGCTGSALVCGGAPLTERRRR